MHDRAHRKRRLFVALAALALGATPASGGPRVDPEPIAVIAADAVPFGTARTLHLVPAEERQLRRAFAVASLASAWLLLRMGWVRLREQRAADLGEI